ncbi:ATP-binding protein [Streptomyces iconiensis]|uniref:ATP-binding protein n=1 Tax=Streptomyces iconiensis TaxID=1384038 RepID=A0ABT6ZWU6_9ACTN|nr:ATP-binding protein [Streptomyces iconiensis]MDJ1133547.1 ATP-binding protein [Streptomyces iconiensis]
MSERTDRVRYPTHKAQAREVRRRAERVLGDWQIHEEVASDVVTVVGELFANAVTHGRVPGREVEVTLRRLVSVVRVEVRDTDPAQPKLHHPQGLTGSLDGQELSESGRGLAIVNILCTWWGCSAEVVGKTVWAEVSLEAVGDRVPITDDLRPEPQGEVTTGGCTVRPPTRQELLEDQDRFTYRSDGT